MDIYIKSFNRAYLLHRTIASIYHYLENFNGRIVVLDDGTPEKYLNKIQQLFPEIELRKSPYYEQKSKAVSAQKVPEKVIPADFWRDEVLKGTEHFILLEDDMWFMQSINYADFTNEVYRLKMDMIKFMWLKNEKLLSANIIHSSEYFKIVHPEVLTRKDALFDAVFRTNKLKLQSVAKRLWNLNDELLNYYHLYIVAGGVFSKRYCEACWKSSQNNVDELNQIRQLLKSKILFNVGNTKQEIIKTTLKSTATLTEKEYLETTVDIFKFNESLNEYWLNNDHFLTDDFEKDLPDDWIEKGLKASELNFEEWKKWYNAFREHHLRAGNIAE